MLAQLNKNIICESQTPKWQDLEVGGYLPWSLPSILSSRFHSSFNHCSSSTKACVIRCGYPTPFLLDFTYGQLSYSPLFTKDSGDWPLPFSILLLSSLLGTLAFVYIDDHSQYLSLLFSLSVYLSWCCPPLQLPFPWSYVRLGINQ